MLTAFLKVLAAVAKYGTKAVKWANDHKDQIIRWLNGGATVAWIVNEIRKAVGA